jgi:ABC-2 type transport system permease protein
MTQAIRVEWQKLRRSMVTLIATASIVVLLPLMALGFYSVALQGGTGPLAQKAGAFLDGEGWEGYLGAVDQIAAVAVFLGAGIVVAWMFGREHADRTFSSLFALPIARGSIAGAKFVVLIGWVTVLSLLLVVAAFALGFVAPGRRPQRRSSDIRSCQASSPWPSPEASSL